MISRAAVVSIALLAFAASPAAAQAPGEVGGPPSYDVVGLGKPLKSFPKLPRARGKPIVIGTGTTSYGRLEVIGQASTKGVCVFIDYLDDGHSGGGRSPATAPPSCRRTAARRAHGSSPTRIRERTSWL